MTPESERVFRRGSLATLILTAGLVILLAFAVRAQDCSLKTVLPLSEAFDACAAHHDASGISYLPPFEESCSEIRDKLAACYSPPAPQSDDMAKIQRALK